MWCRNFHSLAYAPMSNNRRGTAESGSCVWWDNSTKAPFSADCGCTDLFWGTLTKTLFLCYDRHRSKKLEEMISESPRSNWQGAPFALSCGTCRAWGAPAADVKALRFTDLIEETKYLNHCFMDSHFQGTTPFLICLCSNARALSPDPRW